MILVYNSLARINLHGLATHCTYYTTQLSIAMANHRVLHNIFTSRAGETFVNIDLFMAAHASEALSLVMITKSSDWHHDHDILLANCARRGYYATEQTLHRRPG